MEERWFLTGGLFLASSPALEVFGNGFLIPVPSHSHLAIPIPIPVPRIVEFHSHSQITFPLPVKKIPHLIKHNSNVIILTSISRL